MPSQQKIIEAANQILANNSILLRLDKKGMCAGLASLYVRYTLEGKKKEFFQLSKKLIQLSEHYQIGQDNTIEQFIKEIEIAYNMPQYQYAKNNYRDNYTEHTALLIDGKPIRSEFTLGFVDTKQNWASILEQIKNEGRSCYIISDNHGIALSFVDDHYEIYDPNYDDDNEDNPDPFANNTRQFSTAIETIEELFTRFRYPVDDLMGLGIMVFANPKETRPAIYPDKLQLLSASLKSSADYQRKVKADESDIIHNNSLFFAICTNDQETIDYYLQHNEMLLDGLLHLMLTNSNNERIFSFYTNQTDETQKILLIEGAAMTGNVALFQRLVDDYQKNYVTNELKKQEFKELLATNFNLLQVSQIKRPICILNILELYQSYGIDPNTIDEQTRIQIIVQLTKNGDVELLKSFMHYIPPVSEALVLAGLRSAAENDRREALNFWISIRAQHPQTQHDTLIDKQLIEHIHLLNFKQLIETGFTVKPRLYLQALQRNHNEFFELSLSTNPLSVWNDFLQQLKNKTLEEPIDLFSSKEGVSVFQVLISYKENELFKRNWPASIPLQSGIDVLEFACKCGNKELVQFLTQQGVKVSCQFQIDEIRQGLEQDNHQRMDAVLSSAINYTEFFIKSNEKVIQDLIRMGKYQFFIDSWIAYQNSDKDQSATDTNSLNLRRILQLATMNHNKKLYEYIAQTQPQQVLNTIKTLTQSSNTKSRSRAIMLARCLPQTSDTYHDYSFDKFIPDEMSEEGWSTLFSVAISLPNDRLLQAAFERDGFVQNFQKKSTVFLKSLFKEGTPEARFYFHNQMNQQNSQANAIDYFPLFLNYAVSTNDVALFKQLQEHNRFEEQDRMALFEQACQYKAPEIVNELLKSPLVVHDHKKLHSLFDQLFDADNKESPHDAHATYNLIYQRKLNRLYQFVIATKYRPFASLFHSIDELINDSGLSSYKKNQLISSVLSENGKNTLSDLLQRLKTLPDLNEEVLSLFKDNGHNPLIIQVLLNHYKFNEVLAKAMEQHDWLAVVVLLKDRPSTELDPDLRAQLKQYSAEIFSAIYAAAEHNLEQDPRHDLNKLLISTNGLALPDILEVQRNRIQKGIMDIQQLMENQQIDLKNHFYRFDLRDELMGGYAAIKDLTPKIEAFFTRNKKQSVEQIILHELNRNELREFKTTMDAWQLIPAYFEERDKLSGAFDALADFEKIQQQEQNINQKETNSSKTKKADTTPEQATEKPDIRPTTIKNPDQPSSLAGLVSVLEHYKKEREQEYFTHFFIPLFQYTRTDKLNAVTKLINAIQDPTIIITAHDRAVLNNGRLQKRISEYLAENETAIQTHFNIDKPIKTVNQLINTLNKQNPIEKLIYLLERYSIYRSIQSETYHFAIFPQYTGTEKRRAAAHLIEHLKGEAGVLDNKDIGALSQGSLGSMINEFITEFKVPLKEAFNVKRINNLNDLVSACAQNPKAPSLG